MKRFFQQTSMVDKLRRALLGLAIGPLLLSMLVVSAELYVVEQRQLMDQYQRRCQNLAENISLFFNGAEKELEHVDYFWNFDRLDSKKQHEILNLVLNASDYFTRISYLGIHRREYFTVSKHDYSKKHFNPSQQPPYITQAIESMRICYGTIQMDQITGEPSLEIAVPVKDLYHDTVSGVLVATITLHKVWGLVERRVDGTEDDSFVIDAHNQILAHWNPSIVLAGSSYTPPLTPGLHTDRYGSLALVTTSKVALPGNNLLVVITRPLVSAYRMLIVQMATIISILLLTVAISFWLLHRFSGMLLKPIKELTSAAQRISAGETDIRLNLQLEAEMGTLANAFNVMLDKLQHEQALLEQRVEQRTVELQAVLEDAKRASAAKSAFLSRMTHELRTPMNAIIGFSQLLENDTRQSLSADQQENIQEILKAGRHLLELINDMLDLTRIESGRLTLSPEAVAITPLVHECMSLVRPQADKRGITLESDCLTSCFVLADRLRLRQILLNLLSNAIKYNNDHGTIKIRCAKQESGRRRIFVQDSGIGIGAEFLPHLFEPFERAVSDVDGIEGTGIGLALAKQLVEVMGGAIGVESVLKKGSTFWFELPAGIPPELQLVYDNESQAPSEAEQDGNYKILSIEDNPANQRLLKKIFSARPWFTFSEADSAEAGLELVRHFKPDLILMDINLPGMDGFEALSQLRSCPETATIPVISITANAMQQDLKQTASAGFNACLTKPVDLNRLLALIDEILLTDAAPDEGTHL